MSSMYIRIAAAAAFLVTMMAVPETADAVSCTARVVGVRPASQYNHASGRGYLAVRSGAGGKYRQLGELYAGDEVVVYAKRGNWFDIACTAGLCTNPLWGPAYPTGWAHGKYLRLSNACY